MLSYKINLESHTTAVLQSSTGCSEPSGGCGSNYYWNTSNCSCQPQAGTCVPPYGGCPSNTTFNSSTCECVNSSSCNQPPGGCGSSNYWNSATCTCTPLPTATPTPSNSGSGSESSDSESDSSNCISPSAGCGTNYYWNNSTCSCQYYSSTTTTSNSGSGSYSCREPAAGCGSNYYWDSGACLCKVRTTSTTPSISLTQYPNQPTYAPQADVERCLVTNLGEVIYKEIYSGSRLPTYQEHLVFEKCNGNLSTNPIIYITKDQSLPTETDKCLKNVLSLEIYDMVKSGKTDVPAEFRNKVDQCFGIDPHPFQEAKAYKVPEEIKTCLHDSLGESRFNEINSGNVMPSETERSKANICFNKINQTQQNFLPPPPESIHFAQANTKIVNVSDVSQTSRDDDNTLGGQIVFKGKGTPNSTVYIYIFSEPLVVTTTTDENGDWVYELEEPLSGEKHIAYAAVKDTSGKVIRSSVFDFTVIAAETDIQNTFIKEETGAEPARNMMLIYSLIAMSTGLLIAAGLYIFYFQKQLAKSNLPNSTDGKSEGETTSGPIN